MKFLIAILLIALTGCTSSTQFGDCAGLMDKKEPQLNYEISTWNLFVGILFLETLVVPTIVVTKQLECPTSRK